MQNFGPELFPEIKESHKKCFSRRGTSKFNFHLQLIKQLNNPQIKNRYEELNRVSCQMRNLQVQKHFEAVYSTSSSHGSLGIFCPSCPQPGINLPPD
jgi:hypothetical protein